MVKIIIDNPANVENIKHMMRVDMHSHSTASDGRNTAEELIQRAKKLNIKISITDHNEVISSLKACKVGVGIPGIEVTSNNALDLLAYFYNHKDMEDYYKKYIAGHHLKNRGFNLRKLKWSTEELIEKTREYESLIILAHPFTMRPKNSHRYAVKHPWLVKKIDGIEVINSIMPSFMNSRAIEWAKELNKAATGGSDAHMVKFLGNTITCSEADNIEEFLNNIKKKRNYVIGKSISRLHKWHSNLVVFTKNLAW